MTTLAPRPLSTTAIRPRMDPSALAVVLATAYVEIRAGRRPVQQLEPLVTQSLARRLTAMMCRHRRKRRPMGSVSVLRVVTTRIADDALEAAVVVRDLDHVGAVAVRLDRRREDGWIVSDLGAPEDR